MTRSLFGLPAVRVRSRRTRPVYASPDRFAIPGDPVPDARIEVVAGADAGHHTASDATGHFEFRVLPDLWVPTDVHVGKPGYVSTTAHLLTTREVVITLLGEGEPDRPYAVTIAGAEACGELPAPLRRRTYSTPIRSWDATPDLFIIPLGGADFFPELRTIYTSVGASTAHFILFSYEAFQRWWDELPIYERVSATEYLSIGGMATTRMFDPYKPFTISFEGTISYCSRYRDPVSPGAPPQCAVAEIQCRSSQHQLSWSRPEL